jgi:hypothetical protein
MKEKIYNFPVLKEQIYRYYQSQGRNGENSAFG